MTESFFENQSTTAQPSNNDQNELKFDPNLKIKDEPLDYDDNLESLIDIQQESFDDANFKVKEEVIDEEVVIKQEPSSEFIIREIDTEPEPSQVQKPFIIHRAPPQQRFIIKPPSGIIVKPINIKNLRIVPSQSQQKFQILKPGTTLIKNATKFNYTPIKLENSTPIKITNQTPIKFVKNMIKLQHPDAIRIKNPHMTLVENQTTTTMDITKGFKCQYCPNRFLERRFVFEHIKQKHVFSCNMCSSVFPFKITLIKHQMSVHGYPISLTPNSRTQCFKSVCTVCAMRFPNANQLENHMIQKHSSAVKSELTVERLRLSAPPTFKRMRMEPVQNLVKNILKPTILAQPTEPEILEEDADGIPCLDCGLLLRPDKLLRHRIEVHSVNTQNQLFLCDLCGLEIKGKTQVINHMTTKHLSQYFSKCEFCDGLFANQTEVICHKNLQHNFNGTRYTCHFCNKIFNTKRDMILHRKQHYAEKDSRDRLARIFCKKFTSYEPKGEVYQ